MHPSDQVEQLPTAPSQLKRRTLLSAAAAGTSALLLPAAQAQTDAVRLLIGFAPGGSSDMLARVIAPHLSKTLGKNVIVENKPGASGTLAIRQIEQSPPDAQMLAFYPTTTMMGFVLQGQEPALDKVTVIAPMYEQFTVFAVNPTVPGFESVKTLQDLVEAAKRSPGTINYTTAGPGSISHLTAEKLCSLAGIKMQHVAYKGSQPALNDFLAGHVPVAGLDPTVLSAHLSSPKVRPLAINFPKRVAFLPNVPSVAEAGFKELSSVVAWAHLVGPAGMKTDAVAKVHEAMQKAIQDPEISQRILQINAIPKIGSTQAARETMVHDLQYWKQVIKSSNIQAG